MLIGNTTVDAETETPATHSETTTAAATSNHTDDSLVNQSSHPSQFNTNASSTAMDNLDAKTGNESSSTIQMPNIPSVSIDQTSGASDSSKNTTTKRKKNVQLHDHHYHHSVTIITIVSLILLTILIVSVILIGLYVNRSKRMGGTHLTSSSTYVFDQQQQH